MELSHRERSLYYHVLLHSRFPGKDSGLFSLPPLSAALGIEERSIREGSRILQDKGCIQIEEISRRGHLIRAFLPSEINGMVPTSGSSRNGPQEIIEITETVELEAIPETNSLTFVEEPKEKPKPIRQPPTRGHQTEQYELIAGQRKWPVLFLPQMKVPQGAFKPSKSGPGTDILSLKNGPVVTCADCESQKQGSTDENFLRQLYRKGFLSASGFGRATAGISDATIDLILFPSPPPQPIKRAPGTELNAKTFALG